MNAWLRTGAAACALVLPCSQAALAAVPAGTGERLGTVSFPVSCAPAVQASFNRGVALLHDFWYAEARPQFERILESDPGCSMAHWGIAMSTFHQIWDRPDQATMAAGWQQIDAARKHPAGTARERAYIDALGRFFQPGPGDYQTRIDAYSAAMGELCHRGRAT